jgi:hypothetical protein
MKRETYHEETGLEGYFPGREKPEFFPQPPWMGSWRPGKYPSDPGAEAKKSHSS